MAIGPDTTDPTMAMAGDTGARRRGQLMRILKFLVLTPRLKLMLMASTPTEWLCSSLQIWILPRQEVC